MRNKNNMLFCYIYANQLKKFNANRLWFCPCLMILLYEISDLPFENYEKNCSCYDYFKHISWNVWCQVFIKKMAQLCKDMMCKDTLNIFLRYSLSFCYRFDIFMSFQSLLKSLWDKSCAYTCFVQWSVWRSSVLCLIKFKFISCVPVEVRCLVRSTT